MIQRISQFTVTVRDYDEALAFYVDKLGFERRVFEPLGGGKRWVRVGPRGGAGAGILLARAASSEQEASVGRQTGGRVFVFLETDDFRRDYDALSSRGVTFVRPPSDESYGTVAVFEDLYGNRFDLIEPKGRRLREAADPGKNMLDHLSLGVVDLAHAATFYDAVLEPLGFVRVWTYEKAIGYGPPGSDDRLAIKERPAAKPAGEGFHVALAATSRAAVDGFHAAALSHGGVDEGPPGLRPAYGPGYYAAFVRDRDGYLIEAVVHEPQP
ncbi:MAG TPA: VOC family protein [Labilithrix sp.]|nr:VOC family protein [Labilithrix sp.]